MISAKCGKLLAVVIFALASTPKIQAIVATEPFQSGYDVGNYCKTRYSNNHDGYVGCCDGGCTSLHPAGDDAGFAQCMTKCLSLEPQ